MSTYIRIKLSLSITLHKTYVQMDQTPIIKAKAINLVEENIGNFLHDTDMEQNELNRTPFAQDLKPIIYKGGFIKLKFFSITK